jgi:hypothetical protein
VRRVLVVADWTEASAAHFVGTFVGVALVALLAAIGLGCVARWVWLIVRDDARWLAAWMVQPVVRYRWKRSTGPAPSVGPFTAVAAVAPAAVPAELPPHETFDPVGQRDRGPLPQREPRPVASGATAPEEFDFFGTSAARLREEAVTVVTMATRFCREAAERRSA